MTTTTTTTTAEPKIWLDYTQSELDDQYNQRILVPDANDYMARWGTDSERLRGVLECRLDVAYGSCEAERLDIFPAPEDGAPVVALEGGLEARDHGVGGHEGLGVGGGLGQALRGNGAHLGGDLVDGAVPVHDDAALGMGAGQI